MEATVLPVKTGGHAKLPQLPVAPSNRSRISAATAKLLSGYKGIEKTQPQRDAEVIENKTIEGGFEELAGHRTAQGRLCGIKLTQSELSEFLVAIKEFEDEPHFARCGVFISALLNSMDGYNVTVDVSHIDERIHLIGMENAKNLTINGNVGNGTGRSFVGGRITINGTAGYTDIDLISSGKIIVKGGHVVLEDGAPKTCAPYAKTKSDRTQDAIKRMKPKWPKEVKLPAERKNRI